MAEVIPSSVRKTHEQRDLCVVAHTFLLLFATELEESKKYYQW